MENKKLKFIFVHGLSGWGSYDKRYSRMPYWGMRNGDLISELGKKGFDCYAASVSPHGSAHDRACELYAQLAGVKTDYGANHSALYDHDRFGPDFSGRALIEDFEDSRIVLLGHSFGGATVRVFSHIMENGFEDEGNAFFKGGKQNVFALTTLAAPHNGTSAYDLYEDPDFDPGMIRGSFKQKIAVSMMGRANASEPAMNEKDCAAYDMHIDQAMALNERMPLSHSVYYFSQPCCSTADNGLGIHVPLEEKTELLYQLTSLRMGVYKGKTKGGFAVDESWRANDGLVNTVSAMYPLSDPHCLFSETNPLETGIWNVLKTYDGDHMSLQGGMMIRNEVLPYYEKLLNDICDII